MLICQQLIIRNMGIISDYHAAFEAGNKDEMEKILHDECLFIPHVGNAKMTKQDMLGILGSGMVTIENNRILYENDEIGVDHCVAHFANGSTSEAVLTFYQFKDGQIFRVETGATPLSDDYNLIGN